MLNENNETIHTLLDLNSYMKWIYSSEPAINMKWRKNETDCSVTKENTPKTHHMEWKCFCIFTLKTHFTEGLMRLKTEYEENYSIKVNKNSAREYCFSELRWQRGRQWQQQHPFRVSLRGTTYYIRCQTGKREEKRRKK